jgi:ribosomal protein RSM22 (predicted rRNA methylase)
MGAGLVKKAKTPVLTGFMMFPPALTAALDALLEGISRKDLAARAAAMSAAYRAGRSSGGIAGEADALAYALARMPATFAVNAAVLDRLLEVWPDFAPATLLDVGAGTGAASWATRERWPDAAVTMLDANAALRGLAARLMPQATILAGDLTASKPPADLVVASYVLAELPETHAATVAADLWRDTRQALVLIEPGTPQGFARIRAARAALIANGALIAAPCTHDNECPMRGDDWCHFSQRLARSRDHMLLKDGSVPFEDERYSYVVATRQKRSDGARILAPVLEAKPGLTFKLCDANGLRSQFVGARDKDEYRRVKKRGWGDLFD